MMKMDFSNLLTDTYTIILLALFVAAFLFLCLYYGLIWLRVGRYKESRLPSPDQVPDAEWPSVSVVLVAHNEAEQLKKSLPYLLEQDYPDFEIVVVDYLSHDNTPFVLRVCAENYPNLKPITFREDVNMFRGKKYPLSIGIKSATRDIVLLTEPDAVPATFTWIREMMCGYMHGAQMVLGYSRMRDGKGLLAALQQYENLTLTASTVGMSLMGHPYTGSGRNLSYRREFFFQRGAFISHYSVPVGEDDIFVNHNASRSNTSFVLASDAAVEVEPLPDMARWRQRRIEHAVARRYYKPLDRWLLMLKPTALWLLLASAVGLILSPFCPWQLPAAVLILLALWLTVCFWQLAKRLQTTKLIPFAPLFEFYFLLANTISFLTSLRKKKMQWR